VKLLLRFDVLACLAAAFLFTVWPQIDIAVAAVFMRDGRFPINYIPAVPVLHQALHDLPRVSFGVMLVYTLAASVRKSAPWAKWRRQVAYLAIALALGPGIIVGAFKEHWGRARPAQVVELGGDKRFTPALVPSDQCSTNCAFTSGHAATGFYLVALGFVFPRRRRAWIVAGLVAGSVIGLMRMAQGGHFFSDIVFAGFITWFTCLGLAVLMRPARPSGASPPPEAAVSLSDGDRVRL